MEGQLDVCPGSLGTLVIIELLIEDTQHNDYYVGEINGSEKRMDVTGRTQSSMYMKN